MSTPDDQANVTFTVRAVAEPQAMPRLLELFALRGMIPSGWRARRLDGELRIDIEAAGLGRGEAERLAARMRQIVSVRRVLMRDRAPARRSAAGARVAGDRASSRRRAASIAPSRPA